MTACPLPLWNESPSRKFPDLILDVDAEVPAFGNVSWTVLSIKSGESSYQAPAAPGNRYAPGRASAMAVTPRTTRKAPPTTRTLSRSCFRRNR